MMSLTLKIEVEHLTQLVNTQRLVPIVGKSGKKHDDASVTEHVLFVPQSKVPQLSF